MARKRRKQDEPRGVKIELPEELASRRKREIQGRKRERGLAERVAVLEDRARQYKVSFPSELRERMLKMETKGAIKRAWRDYLSTLPGFA
jgi:hypothetical protein